MLHELYFLIDGRGRLNLIINSKFWHLFDFRDDFLDLLSPTPEKNVLNFNKYSFE